MSKTDHQPSSSKTAMVLTTRSSTAYSLREYLNRERYQVHHFTSCEDAMRFLDSKIYDLALVDEFIEDTQGIHFIREARIRGFEKPMVLISGDYHEALSRLRDQPGICRPITAPVSFPSLRHCLRLLEDAKSHHSYAQPL